MAVITKIKVTHDGKLTAGQLIEQEGNTKFKVNSDVCTKELNEWEGGPVRISANGIKADEFQEI